MMYNEKRKAEYIKYAVTIDAAAERVYNTQFAKTYSLEKKYDKDLCDWNVNEILDFYQSLITHSLESLMVLHSLFQRYTTWCLNNLLVKDSQNHFEEIDRHILNAKCVNSSYLKQGIVTREQLLNILSDEDMVRNPYEKFILLGIYEGIGGKGFLDFRNLSMKNIKDNIITLPNRELKISDELVKLAKLASSEYKYQSYGNIAKNSYSSFDEQDERIIKRKEGCKELSDSGYTHKMIVNLEKIKENNDDLPVFNQSMLFQSGRLEMIRKFMKQDNCEAIVAIKKHLDEIAYRYRTIQGIQRYCDKWSEFLYLED